MISFSNSENCLITLFSERSISYVLLISCQTVLCKAVGRHQSCKRIAYSKAAKANFYEFSQVILAGTLTGAQGNIRCKIWTALPTVK